MCSLRFENNLLTEVCVPFASKIILCSFCFVNNVLSIQCVRFASKNNLLTVGRVRFALKIVFLLSKVLALLQK
jgi:hypothetical protein